MTKRAFDKIKVGLEDAKAFAEGRADAAQFRAHVPPEVDVPALRKRLKLSQQAFAARFGISLARLRDWEQNRSRPDGAVRAYLMVIAREPEAVERALSA